MPQRTHVYEVQKGDNVLPKFVGTKVELIDFTTMAEAVANGHFENESAVMAAAYRDRHIASNRKVRTALSKLQDGETDTAAIARAVRDGNAVKIGAATERKTPATAKPQTVKRRAAESTGNRLFEKCLADGNFLRKGISEGWLDEGEYKAWLANKDAKANSGNGATQATQPQAAPAPVVETPKATPRPAARSGR